ncbi:MAG: AbrB/MazE/SpoVT family DNA-binding domain-containing protein [Magnetococcales bacterium]|nr:AbrB/MazE/SpoVT family DNA-binding domain-containing protein [Magnetococcales bacterium]
MEYSNICDKITVRALKKPRDMNIAILDRRGGVTIPQEIRDQMNLRPGDRLAFRISGGDELVVHRLPPQTEETRDRRTEVPTVAEIDQANARRLEEEIRLRHTSWSDVSSSDDWQ